MSTTPVPVCNLAAEVRAVEEGHRAFLDRDAEGVHVRVVSDTVHGKWYRVTAEATDDAGSPILFSCAPRGTNAGTDDHGDRTGRAGATPCKHAAVAARRLEREGLARLVGGRWTAAGTSAPAEDPYAKGDPFDCFPRF